MLTVPFGLVYAAEEPPQRIVVGPDREIYGSEKAVELVAEARKHDPMWCQPDQANRDKAVRLYEEAIAAQPDAPINAPLANRIAQLYAFYESEDRTVRPIPTRAQHWWRRCTEYTDPTQLLWAQGQMGLASAAVMSGDYRSALERYNRIMEMDFEKVQLPKWKAWPDPNSEAAKASLEREHQWLQERVQGIHARAAEKRFYALRHIAKPAALDALQQMAVEFKGTPTGDRASKMMESIRANARKDPWALPDLASGDGAAQAGERSQPQPGPVVSTGKRPAEPGPSTPAAVDPPDGDHRILPAAAVAVGGVVVAVAAFAWIRRRGRLLKERRAA